jgi:hypothetical protein
MRFMVKVGEQKIEFTSGLEAVAFFGTVNVRSNPLESEIYVRMLLGQWQKMPDSQFYILESACAKFVKAYHA